MTRWSSSTFFLARPKVPSYCLVSPQSHNVVMGGISTYSLLGELTGTLVLAVAEQLDDSALVGGKTEENLVSQMFHEKYPLKTIRT